ncbi:hypothetical protein GQ53DRAFT_798175 [Thozetella sp. PMI_491]|nr:hypothetical protein GQ53DRAFT_798175 [Thozetella sp. PMI_491]
MSPKRRNLLFVAVFAIAIENWVFDPAAAANTHAFSYEKCNLAFPKLFQRIDESVSARGRNAIQLSDLAMVPGRCLVKIMIYDGELFIIDTGKPEDCYVSNQRERILGTLHLISRAVSSSPEPVPNIEAVISTDDSPRRSIDRGVLLGFTRPSGEDWANIWLLPDYGYWSWEYTGAPSWEAIRRKIYDLEKELSWADKINKAIWRGKADANPVRQELIDVAKDKPWSDIQNFNVVQMLADDTHAPDRKTLPEFCQYRFPVHTEGYTYSGRLKYLQQCRSVVVTHPLQWEEFHTHLLRSSGPERNFIQTAPSWEDLDQRMTEMMNSPDEAERIANRSYNVFAKRYLTPAAISCYIRRLIDRYASLQDFEVALYEKNKHGKLELRGVPFSSFVIHWPKDPSIVP